ncbi:MAG: hypothetical protein FWJ83_04730 [Limnochordales bacterium]
MHAGQHPYDTSQVDIADVAALVHQRLDMHGLRLQHLLRRLQDGPATVFELARAMFAEASGQQLMLALSEVQGHLDVLEALEKVRSGPAPAGGDPAGALVYSAVGSGEADGAAPAGRAE